MGWKMQAQQEGANLQGKSPLHCAPHSQMQVQPVTNEGLHKPDLSQDLILALP
jgi:hypothetical protein